MEIKVSVIIPVYNEAEALPACLDSVLSQTLGALEVLCVDDGSTDESARVIAAYAQRDERIVPLSQPGAGSGAARNRAIAAARGGYVAFMDADDCFADARVLDTLYRLAVDKGVRVAGGNLVERRARGDTRQEPVFTQARYAAYREFQQDYGYSRFLYERAFLMENELLFPDYLRGQDPPFLVRALLAAGRYYIAPLDVYVYHIGAPHGDWTARKVLDVIHSLTDLLRLSADEELAILHRTVVERFAQYNYFLQKGMDDYGIAVQRALYRADACVRTALLREAGLDVSDDFVLKPLQDRFDMLDRMRQSRAYRIGRAATAPARWLRKIRKRLRGPRK